MSAGKRRILAGPHADRAGLPHELDELMTVTQPRAWLALAGIGALLVAGTMWGVRGRIPFTVEGRGIFVYRGGLHNAIATGGGRVDAVLVEVGARVAAGELLVRVEQPELRRRLQAAEAAESAEREKLQSAVPLTDRTRRLQEAELTREAEHVARRVAALSDRLATAAADDSDRLGDVAELAEAQGQQAALARRRIELQQLARADALIASQSLSDLHLRTEALRVEHAENSEIRSPVDAVVAEVAIFAGDTVAPGQPVIRLEPSGVPASVVAYLPFTESREIRAGMEAHIEPASVRKADVGYVVGKVTRVSPYPVSRAAVLNLLGDPDLANYFTSTGPAMAVEVALDRDPRGEGYLWSTGRAAELQLGTLCAVEIVLREEPPIVVLLPGLRRMFGF
jgi:HlyD family secretion protein